MTSNLDSMIDIFLPYYNVRRKEVESKNLGFAHYTNAQAAMNIIKTKEVWLKKITRMNDYSETYHGYGLLQASYKSRKDDLKKILDEIFPDIIQEVEDNFNHWWNKVRYETYIACFSEFDWADEDNKKLGRLSMWRAYGGNAGVCIVMKNAPFFNESGAFKAATMPVIYADDKEFEKNFSDLVTNIKTNINFIREFINGKNEWNPEFK